MVASSKEYQEAIELFVARNKCDCIVGESDIDDIDISLDVVKQFSIYRDGSTLDGELYIGDEPRWSAVCGNCGNEFELDSLDESLLHTIAEDFV